MTHTTGRLPTGRYNIKWVEGGLYLTVNDSTEGTGLTTAAAASDTKQKFDVVDGKGGYAIKNVAQGLCSNTKTQRNTEKTEVVGKVEAQRFAIEEDGSGTYRVITNDSTFCWTVREFSSQDNTKVDDTKVTLVKVPLTTGAQDRTLFSFAPA